VNQPAQPSAAYYPTQVSRLNLASAKFQRYKALLRRRWWLLFLAASIGVCFQAWQVTTKPTTYVSYARLVAGGSINVTKGPQYRELQVHGGDFYGSAMEVLRSGEVRKRATERVEALNPDLKITPVTLRIDRNPGSTMLNVAATGREPKYTVAFLNALLDEFMSFRKEMKTQVTEVTLSSITEELVRLEDQLIDEEAKLEQFLSENSLMVLEERGNKAATYLASLQSRMSGLETELSLLNLMDPDKDLERRQRMEESVGSIESGDESSSIAQEILGFSRLGVGERRYLELRQDIELLMLERASKLKVLKPLHPSVVEVDKQIAKQITLLEIYKRQSDAEAAGRREGMNLQLQNLAAEIAKWEEKALDMSVRQSKHDSINSGIERVRKRYDSMLTMLQDIDVNEQLQTDYISIMERASNAIPTEPKMIRPIMVGLLLGLLAGLLIVFLFDRLDDRMTSFSEFQTQFSEDVLGQIPQQSGRGQLPLLEANDGRHLYGEAFRNLRSSIIFKDWGGNPPKTIAVCSAVPNEGKTTVATNLGITMALAGARVLVVDGDLRRGAMNDLLDRPSTPGFSDVLMDRLPLEDAVTDTHVQNMSFLPRGEAIDQTSEYVLSDRCTRLLEEVADAYDYIIFDTAPVLVADDTASFAPKCDATLFVVRLSSTMARLAAKAMGVLYDRQVNVGGVVLNRASTSLKEYSYYNYASYYTARPTTPPPAAGDQDGSDTPDQPGPTKI